MPCMGTDCLHRHTAARETCFCIHHVPCCTATLAYKEPPLPAAEAAGLAAHGREGLRWHRSVRQIRQWLEPLQGTHVAVLAKQEPHCPQTGCPAVRRPAVQQWLLHLFVCLAGDQLLLYRCLQCTAPVFCAEAWVPAAQSSLPLMSRSERSIDAANNATLPFTACR